MSIICKTTKGWVLDHSDYIRKTYMSVDVQSILPLCTKSFCYDENLFKMITPFLFDSEATNAVLKKKSKRKRTRSDNFLSLNSHLEVYTVKSALEQLITLAKENGHYNMSNPCEEDFHKNNEQARQCSTLFFNDVCQEKMVKCSGGNTAKTPLLVNIHGQDYLIPNSSKFFCCDVQELRINLPENSKFDFILLDPPWWNKYVRRRKVKQESAGYKMMYNEEVCTLPVASWLAPGALVAVWCTNCAHHKQDIITQWFPRWGLSLVATWYWVKVTCGGQPVCRFSPPPGKQPYERIMFGAAEDTKGPRLPDNQCIISVPSAVHSHKPPLLEVMKPYLPSQPQCLELFARYLLPDCTSAGDQVLALQNLKLFKQL